MKKLLSFALALVLCLGLTIPASAANQPGDTTIKDAKGNTYTLSKPILYTISKEQIAGLSLAEDYVYYTFTGEELQDPKESLIHQATAVYAVPEGTVIKVPDDVVETTQSGSTKTSTTTTIRLEPNIVGLNKSGNGYVVVEEYFTYFEGVDDGYYQLSTQDAGYENTFYVMSCLESSSSTSEDINTGSGAEGGSIPDTIDTIAFFVPTATDLQSTFPGGSSTSKPATPATPKPPVTPTAPTTGKPAFTDVADSAYYAEPVKWAVEKNITGGTTATTFSPNQTCSTAQILTFLWRSKGSPEPTSKTNPYTDVKESAYYYKAALWAKENEVLPRPFKPELKGDAPCTRGMAMLYIWKAAGSYAAEKKGSFADVPSKSIYAPSVDWAVETGITGGTTATTFSPDATCTRAQIVTFLYRAFK